MRFSCHTIAAYLRRPPAALPGAAAFYISKRPSCRPDAVASILTCLASRAPGPRGRAACKFDGNILLPLRLRRRNRAANYKSTTGALDATATEITTYKWGGRNRLNGLMHQPSYGAEPDEVISPAAGASDSSREEAARAAANRAARPTDRPAVKIAFVSPHCVVDFTNGAATATLDALVFLQSLGFRCEAFCNSRLDSWDEAIVEHLLAERGLPCKASDMRIGSFRGRMIFTLYRGLPVTIFRSVSTRGAWRDREEVSAFLTGCNIFLNKKRPDLVWTYGGDEVARQLHRVVRGLGIPLLFALHNFAYRDRGLFAATDRAIVPTQFAQDYYREKLGLDCELLPLVLDPGRVQCAAGDGEQGAGSTARERDSSALLHAPCSPLPARYVTFVNPVPRKGVHVFARIAEVLSQRRPDIPLLLVEGEAKSSSLLSLGVDLSGLTNLTVRPNTPDARQLLAASKLILMPSLMENAGCIAREAMFNGIPVLASNRGGLPETVGSLEHGAGSLEQGDAKAGFLFDIPARYTPETREVPSAEEVAPWVEAIIRLWDDAAYYDHCSRAARERAEAWRPERLAPLYREFFGRYCANKPVGPVGCGRVQRDPPATASIGGSSLCLTPPYARFSDRGRQHEQGNFDVKQREAK